MLTAFCITLCLCGAESPIDAPVSAEAAVYRARFERARHRHAVHQETLAHQSPEKLDGFREALFAMPVARVNETTITASDVLVTHRRNLIEFERKDGLYSRSENVVNNFLRVLLPRVIEHEILWQAAQRDLNEEQFSQLVAFLEFQFDNRELLKLVDELKPQGDPVALLIEAHHTNLPELQRDFVRKQVANQYLAWKVVQPDADQSQPMPERCVAIVAAERRKAVIQTAFELPE